MSGAPPRAAAAPPLFSICLPVWNDAELVHIAVEGVLSQTEPRWQLIVGDNASTDDLRQVISEYGDPRIIYHAWDAHLPLEENFNRTMALATGEWVIPIGADDRLHTSALAVMIGAVSQGPWGDRPDAASPAMVLTACRRVFPNGSSAEAAYYGSRRAVTVRPGRYDAATWLRVGASGGPFPWNIGSAAFAAGALRAAGGLRPEVGLSADTELIFRIAAFGDVIYVDQPQLDFMVRIDSDGNRRWATTLREGSSPPMARALESALDAHAQHRRVSRAERRAISSASAQSHLRRAAQHRILPGGRGRSGALHDVVAAVRLYPRALLRPEGLLLAGGALLAPGWLLRGMSTLMQERAHAGSALRNRKVETGASATATTNRP